MPGVCNQPQEASSQALTEIRFSTQHCGLHTDGAEWKKTCRDSETEQRGDSISLCSLLPAGENE